MASDWLQGPYVYALYRQYQFSPLEIGQLFVAGFSSSMVMGTFVGALADKVGRKKMALCFCAVYAASCATKLVNSFAVLMAGRLLAGVATSLLFSVFEAWLVSEHRARRFPESSLARLFALATTANALTAISSGLAASLVARLAGFVAPFLLAMAVLALAALLIARTWTENFGDASLDLAAGFRGALEACRDPRVWLLGSVTALFEAAMYAFVFLWSPLMIAGVAADSIRDEIPFGLVFACFMVAIMIGSSLFSLALSRGFSPHACLRAALFLAASSLSAPLWTSDWRLLLSAFLLFELSCGLYFPASGTLRGRVIPERSRSAVMNLFRLPLNALVVAVLLNIENMSTPSTFAMLVAWLLLALVAQQVLLAIAAHDAGLEAKSPDENAPKI